ncbi:hypothetical protein ABTX77_40290 [Streptomyces sp. NPDC097704]|uniref:hypothetical protein n=1 Tax=Streptomyces sp. NPDC097704 TaxID=3157101 RepID=UPI003333D631
MGGQAAGEVDGELTGRRAAPAGAKLLQELEQLDRLVGLGVGEQSEAGLVRVGGRPGGVIAHAMLNSLVCAGERSDAGPSSRVRQGSSG